MNCDSLQIMYIYASQIVFLQAALHLDPLPMTLYGTENRPQISQIHHAIYLVRPAKYQSITQGLQSRF